MLDKLFFRLLIIFGILALFYATNPSYSDHKSKINQEYKDQNPISGFLGAGRAVGGLLTNYNDYWLVSTTDLDGGLISIGILGKVFVLADLKVE